MSKERLEEIKDNELLFTQGYEDLTNDFLWLIEQAKQKQSLETAVDFYESALRDADRRVEELEGAIKGSAVITNIASARNKELEDQNKRYREALDKIIGSSNKSAVVLETALIALEGESECTH